MPGLPAAGRLKPASTKAKMRHYQFSAIVPPGFRFVVLCRTLGV